MKKTDESIWKRFQDGDERALTDIYEAYADALYSYGLRLTNDDSLVKDCIQEVFIQLIDRRKALILSSCIPVYLFKSFRNKLVEELRSSNRRQDILKLLYKEKTAEGHAEQSLIDDEERQAIQKDIQMAMDRLTDRQKEVIYLKYNKDFDCQEIAELLGIDKASVSTLLYRSIKIMRKAFLEKMVSIQP